jgi:hypothetical protein
MHTELPDNLVPYKRYSVEVIEAVATDSRSEIPADTNTRQKIKRWYHLAVGHFKAVWQRLVKRDLLSPNTTQSLKNMVKAVVNSGFWSFHPFGNGGRAQSVLRSS